MRKLLAFLIALGAIVFAVISPVRANRVLFLAGPKPASPFSFARTAVDTTFDTTSPTLSNTYTSKSFGSAASSRVIVVAVGWGLSASGLTPVTSMTIGGVSAAPVEQDSLTGSPFSIGAKIWSAAVPSGTSGNIVINFTTNAPGVLTIAVYSLIAHTTGPSVGDAASTSSPLAATLTIPAGGIGLGVVYETSTAAVTTTPTGFTADYSDSSVSGLVFARAFSTPGALTGSQTLSFTQTQTQGAAVFAAWGP